MPARDIVKTKLPNDLFCFHVFFLEVVLSIEIQNMYLARDMKPLILFSPSIFLSLRSLKGNKLLIGAKIIILCLSVVQQNMRITRQIVLPLLTKALYKFGCFKGFCKKPNSH